MVALEPEEEGATQFKLNAYIEGRRVKTGNPPTRNSEEAIISLIFYAMNRHSERQDSKLMNYIDVEPIIFANALMNKPPGK